MTALLLHVAGIPLPGWMDRNSAQLQNYSTDQKKSRGKKGNSKAEEQSPKDEFGSEKDVLKIILEAVENVKPFVTVKSQKVAAKVMFVPGTLAPAQQQSLAVRWILQAAANRKKNAKADFSECLALEFLMAYQKKGAARQKRDDVHKLALQNRSNVHMRWW